MLLMDFVLSTLFLVVALLWNPDSIRYEIGSWLVIDIELIALLCIVVSLFYEIYNFGCIHKLHGDIEDAVIAEVIGKNAFLSLIIFILMEFYLLFRELLLPLWRGSDILKTTESSLRRCRT